MKKMLFLLILIQFAGTAKSEEATSDAPEFIQQEWIRYAKIHLETRPELIIERELKDDPEAVVLSPDGSRIGWIDKRWSSGIWQPVNMWFANKVDGEFVRPKPVGKPWGIIVPYEKFNLYTGMSFGNNNNVVASEEGYQIGAISRTSGHSLLSNEDAKPVGYKSCIKIDYKRKRFDKSAKQKELCVEDFGLEKGDFLQHPRISPNGQFLAIYIKGENENNKPGIYLYDLQEDSSFHAEDFPAKHPTWSPDGDKLLFHYQIGGNTKDGSSLEKAVIGYYEIDYEADNIVGDRILMDDVNQEDYIYHKHPTVVPNSNLLFFHGQTKVDGKKKLFVRQLVEGSKIWQIRMLGTDEDHKMHSSKHPATSYETKELYFIGKEKERSTEEGVEDVKGPKQIYRLNIDALEEISGTVNK